MLGVCGKVPLEDNRRECNLKLTKTNNSSAGCTQSSSHRQAEKLNTKADVLQRIPTGAGQKSKRSSRLQTKSCTKLQQCTHQMRDRCAQRMEGKLNKDGK